jgi:hypothetical protein
MPQEQGDALDASVKAALDGRELTMGELVEKLGGSFPVRDIKTRVLELIPQTIELTRDLGLKLTH